MKNHSEHVNDSVQANAFAHILTLKPETKNYSRPLLDGIKVLAVGSNSDK